MTSKHFEKEVKKIVAKFPSVNISSRYDFELKTIMGDWYFSLGYTPRIKVAYLHSRFNLDTFDIMLFKKYISNSYDISTTCKWNHYSENPEYILDLLEETIDNFEFLTKKDKS